MPRKLLVEYGSFVLGGKPYICPLKSISVALACTLQFTPDKSNVNLRICNHVSDGTSAPQAKTCQRGPWDIGRPFSVGIVALP